MLLFYEEMCFCKNFVSEMIVENKSWCILIRKINFQRKVGINLETFYNRLNMSCNIQHKNLVSFERINFCSFCLKKCH